MYGRYQVDRDEVKAEQQNNTPEEKGTSDSFVSRVQDRTRIYDVLDKDTRVMSGHKWIGEGDDPVIRPVRSDTMIGIDRSTIPPPMDDRRTRVGRDSNTRVVSRPASRMPGMPLDGDPGDSRSFRETVTSAAGRVRETASAVRNVKVGDSVRFTRFLKIMAVFLIILILEIGYFAFASHVSNMPAETEKAKKELELTKKENAILEDELAVLGDHDSAEELRQSWERLRDKLKEATAETYY